MTLEIHGLAPYKSIQKLILSVSSHPTIQIASKTNIKTTKKNIFNLIVSLVLQISKSFIIVIHFVESPKQLYTVCLFVSVFFPLIDLASGQYLKGGCDGL